MSGNYAALTRVLRFWFQEAGPKDWFAGDAAFDQRTGAALGELHGQAAAGAFDAWRDAPEGCLALCILLDQVPRHIFRGTPRAFATDAQALAVARHAVDKGFDLGMAEDQRLFVYLPFEHAEDMDSQRQSVRLFASRTTNADHLDYACLHLAVICRFGRFPHRNAALGRETTPEEQAFLAQPGSGF